MPEGHVIHRLANGLTDWFGGQAVRVTSPQGRFADEAALLDGSVLSGAEAYGKHLFIDFGPDRIVHVHLGLIGKLWLIDGEPTSPAGPETLRLRIARDQRSAELRGPQWCRLITDEARDAVIAAAGDRIDALANVAGINDDFSPLHETTDDMWDRVIGVNLTGLFKLTRGVLPAMIAAGTGSIINIASEAGLRRRLVGAVTPVQ